MKILETERLRTREITVADAEFVLSLLNEPAFIQNIGDRKVRDSDGARKYIEEKFIGGYRQFNFGMYAVELKNGDVPIGICGFVKRPNLPAADIGFAFLSEFWKQGYALEAAAAMLDYGRKGLNFQEILAITALDNEGSIKLLKKIGFEYRETIRMPDGDEVKLFHSSGVQ